MSYLSEKGWGPVSATLHNTTRGKCSPVSIYTHSNRLQLEGSHRLSVGCAGLSTTGCAWLSTTGCAGYSPVVRRLCLVVHNRLCLVVRRLCWFSTTGCAGCSLVVRRLCRVVRRLSAGCAQHVVPARTTFYPPYKTGVFTHLATESKY